MNIQEIAETDKYTITFQIDDREKFKEEFLNPMFQKHLYPEQSKEQIGATVTGLGFGNAFEEKDDLEKELLAIENINLMRRNNEG